MNKVSGGWCFVFLLVCFGVDLYYAVLIAKRLPPSTPLLDLFFSVGKEVHANRNFYASHHHNLHPSPLKYAPMHMVPTQLQDNPMREKTEYEISAREGTAFCSSAKKIRLS